MKRCTHNSLIFFIFIFNFFDNYFKKISIFIEFTKSRRNKDLPMSMGRIYTFHGTFNEKTFGNQKKIQIPNISFILTEKRSYRITFTCARSNKM